MRQNMFFNRPGFIYLPLLHLILLLFSFSSYAEVQKFSSGKDQVSLVELYTSEGCSSCPPAEKWLGSLKNDEKLWTQFVPLAFHVDYWDYIGWKDPFADPEYGLRQRQYKAEDSIRTVYTPGIILNGKEWRQWYFSKSVPETGQAVGDLIVHVDGDRVSASFTPEDSNNSDWELNIAVLGFDLESDVNSGENAGRKLKQEFVVLGYRKENTDKNTWQTNLPGAKKEFARKTALAVWVNKKGDQTPVQATGGWLVLREER